MDSPNVPEPEASRARAFLPNHPRVIEFDETQSLIVTIVSQTKGVPITGYQIVQRSNGALNINSIYVQIDRLVALGVLHSEYAPIPEGSKPKLPKRMISLGTDGQVLFAPASEGVAHEPEKQTQIPVFSGLQGTRLSV